MKCLTCNGMGFIEYESGVFQVRCEECKGTGEIGESLSDVAAEANTFANSLMPRLEGEKQNDSISGTDRDNQPSGSGNPGKSKLRPQPKVKKKSRKRPKKIL